MERDSEASLPKLVPKFTSFRPRGLQEPSSGNGDFVSRKKIPEIAQTSESQWEEHEGKADRRGRIQHQPQDASKHHRYHHSQGRTDQDQASSRVRSPQVAVSSWDATPELSVIDTKGDPANLTYGALHRYTIPAYFRSGRGSVLGLLSRHKIDREASSEKKVVISTSWRDHSKQRRIELWKANLREKQEMHIRPDRHPASTSHEKADFLALKNTSSRERRQGLTRVPPESASSSNESESHYRSIYGKAKPATRPEDSDLEYDSTTSMPEGENPKLLEIYQRKRQKGVHLSRRVHEDPRSLDAWLDLIKYQDEDTGRSQYSSRTELTNAERISIADIKLSMYEEALGKITDRQAQERLVLGMMDEGSKLWDTKTLFAKWQNALRKHPQQIGLWMRYLDFQQTSFSTFRFDEVRNVYNQSIRLLREAKPQVQPSEVSHDEMIELQLYILVRLALFLREAGFSENAVALWQALLEYNCFLPKEFEGDQVAGTSFTSTRMNAFEKFWDSEIPRIGEVGAQGWSHFALHGGDTSEANMNTSQAAENGGTSLGRWVEEEFKCAIGARVPARTIDDVKEDDPYRVVLFTDIRESLVDLTSSPHGIDLISAFLAFCHFPPLPYHREGLQTSPWWRDPFIRNQALEHSLLQWRHQITSANPQDTLPSFLEVTEKTASSKGPFAFPMSSYLITDDTLFSETSDWFSAFDGYEHAYVENVGSVDLKWVRRVLKTLVDQGFGDDLLAEYIIAFECKVCPEQAKKTAKNILKKRSSSLRLYNAYALVEYRLGKAAAAETVLITAINMSKTLHEAASLDVVLLWRTWIWKLLDSRGAEAALRRLLTYADRELDVKHESVRNEKIEISEIAPAAVLRTQRALNDGRDYVISIGSYTHAVLYAECLVMLVYLSNSLSLEAALQAFASNIELFPTRLTTVSAIHEVLHQFRAKLLHYHIKHTHSYRPSIIRSVLAESIHAFPRNTIFLSLYAWNESRFRIDDRVRSIIQDVVLHHESVPGNVQDEQSVISHFFAIYIELNRSLTLGSNTYTIRNTFERAIADDCGKRSAGLWKLYFTFEHSRGDMEKAKMVFYRAVRACPWVKGLYMLAFERLRDVMSMEELKGVHEMMVEKEIRVHVDLNEWLERMGGGVGGKG